MLVRARLPILLATFLLAALSDLRLSAQDAAAARSFLHSVYRNYSKGGPGVDVTSLKARKILTSPLISLLHADQKAVGSGEVGALDGDPICGCQDWDGIFDLKISIRMRGPGSAKAAVSFALFAPQGGANQDRRSLEISLLGQGGQWRIDNVVDRSDPKVLLDLREESEKEILEANRAARQQ